MGLDSGQPCRIQLGKPGLQFGKPCRGGHAPVHRIETLGRGAQPGRGGARLREPRFQRGDAIREILPGSVEGGDPLLGRGSAAFQSAQLGLPPGQGLLVVRVVLQRGGVGLGRLGPGCCAGAAPAREGVVVRLWQQVSQFAGSCLGFRDGLGEQFQQWPACLALASRAARRSWSGRVPWCASCSARAVASLVIRPACRLASESSACAAHSAPTAVSSTAAVPAMAPARLSPSSFRQVCRSAREAASSSVRSAASRPAASAAADTASAIDRSARSLVRVASVRRSHSSAVVLS